MNEIEMDLLLANIENAMLKAENEKLREGKCKSHEDFEVVETHRNVTVEINRCQKCGHIETTWHRPEDTEAGGIDG